MSSDLLTLTVADDGLARLTLDDGKANALSHDMIAAIHGALDEVEASATAVVLTGRPGRMSAGFDLRVMAESPAGARELVAAGARLLCRMMLFPKPIVAACSGHALAAGAMLLLASDVRLGPEPSADVPDYKVGLNEVAIGMTMPVLGLALAAWRIPDAHREAAVTFARIYGATGAVEASFLDRLVPADELLTAADAEARTLAALNPRAFAGTKVRMREHHADRILSTLDTDLEVLTPG